MDEAELRERLDEIETLGAGERIGSSASPELIGFLRQYLWKHLGAPPGS